MTTFERLMKDKDFKEKFDKGYNDFLLEEEEKESSDKKDKNFEKNIENSKNSLDIS